MKTLGLIDADILLYMFAARHESTIDWGGDLTTTTLDPEAARRDVGEYLDELRDVIEADRYLIVLSCHHLDPDLPHGPARNWRYEVMGDYKMNRSGKPKPALLGAVRQFIAEEYAGVVKSRDGMEADDVIGIMATHPRFEPGYRKVIVSLDKDFRTIPAPRYVPEHHGKPAEYEEISLPEANWHHMYQTLTGDTVDGYAGCPGIGPVKAEAALEPAEMHPGLMWEMVVRTYEEMGYDESDALIQARVARILRAGDYDFRTQEVRLWTPPRARKARH